jgi:hypothetical protein
VIDWFESPSVEPICVPPELSLKSRNSMSAIPVKGVPLFLSVPW